MAFTDKRWYNKDMKKIIIKIIFWIVLICTISLGGYFFLKKMTVVKTEKLHATVSKTLEQSAELCLYKMNYTDIITIKKRGAMGLAKSYSIVKYSCIIRAGIKNIDDITFSISEDLKSIEIFIPPAELLGNDITTQTVFDESQNIFVPIRIQEIFDEIEIAKDDAAKELLAEGFLDDADKRAQDYIKQLMYALGFNSVKTTLK